MEHLAREELPPLSSFVSMDPIDIDVVLLRLDFKWADNDPANG
jgi:hypothetical protein